MSNVLQYDDFIARLLSDDITMTYLRAMSKVDSGGWTKQDAVERRNMRNSENLSRKGLSYIVLENGNPIGICGLRSIDWMNRSGEMGVILHHTAWRRGICAEAHGLMLDYIYNTLKLHRVFFITATTNNAMIGFCRSVLRAHHDGTMRDFFALSAHDAAAGYVNAEIYSILSHEWPSIREKVFERVSAHSTPSSTSSVVS